MDSKPPTSKTPSPSSTQSSLQSPRRVKAAKFVNLAMVEWVDDDGVSHTSFAAVGDNNIQLIDPKVVGLAGPWLKSEVFAKLKGE
jgi:hypothetical protein